MGIQGGFLSKDDILDTNYIASQEAANLGFAGEGTYQIEDDYAIGSQGEPSGHSYNIVAADNVNKGLGLVQTTNYNGGEKYTSGSLILDDYRLPAASSITSQRLSAKGRSDSGKYRGNDAYPGVSPKYDSRYNSGAYYRKDNSGKYVHNPAGDRAKPYEHRDVPPVPYSQVDTKYTQGYSFDTGKYKGTTDRGSYSQSSHGGYDYPKPAIAFNEEPQSLYKIEGQLDGYTSGAAGTTSGPTSTYYGSYSTGNVGEYVSDKDYADGPHVLTAGAVRVGLVGKTTLIDNNYAEQENYQGQSYSQDVIHQTSVAEPAASVTQFGTTAQSGGYSYVTNPTSSGVPTTATPLPVTYKTTYVPLVPKTSIKQVFGYTQPAVTYVQPTVVPVKQVTPQIQVTDYNQGLNYEFESRDYSSASNTGSTGYSYTKPAVRFEEGISYTTAAPAATVISYNPQGFGRQQNTINKVESVGFEYSTPRPVTEQPFRKLVAYTTGTPETYVQPSAQSFSQQTIHKVESANVYTPSIDVYSQVTKAVNYEVPQTVIQYTTPQPVISLQPESYSQQTLHQVDTSKINNYEGSSVSGYEYSQPAAQFEQKIVSSTASTYQPQYSQQTIQTIDNSNVNTYSQQEEGYQYQQPSVYVQNTGVQYSTAAPTASYKPQSYSSQTIQRYNTQQYVPVSSTPRPVTPTPVTVYENPLLKYTVKATPATYVSPAYTSQSFSQQSIYRGDSQSTAGGSSGYEYQGNRYEQPQTTVYTTAQPSISVQPQSYSQQTLHQVDTSKINNNEGSSISGYEYSQPAVQFEQNFVSSTPAPIVTTTYRPQTYRQKVVSTTTQPNLLYQLTDVTLNENPLIQYTQNAETVTYVKPTASVFTRTYQPVQQTSTSYVSRPVEYESSAQQSYQSQGYSYSQPEAVSNVATANAASYSDASAVSHQVIHQSNGNAQYETGKNVVFISTTPSTLLYEDHYTEYESPKKIKTYKAPEYMPPKQQYQQEISYSTASTPIYNQESSIVQIQDQYDYRPVEYSQQYEGSAQFTDTRSSLGSSQNVESVRFSTIPDTKAIYQYNQQYQSPEIQVGYKAEEYLPPVVSTQAPVIVTSTYRPRTYSTTSREYLPPTTKPKYTAPEYLPPVNTYVTQSTAKPEIKSLEYLPPAGETGSRVVNYESFGYNDDQSKGIDSRFGSYQDFSVPTEAPIVVSSTAGPVIRKQNIVVESRKSNLLGFGTVGPDAGLVSTTYTTAQPVVSSTNNYYVPSKTVTSTYAPEIVEVTSAPRRTKTKYFRPAVKSTTESNYYVESTTFKAPEYLPPSEENLQEGIESFRYKSTAAPTVKYNPYQEQVTVSTTTAPKRKQNIVVETAKSQLLGYGSVGTDAGLVSSSSYATPESVQVSYSTVPVRQEIVEVTSARAPIRRTKPKVAVVTKINDFNPLLVKKLGAVCSCQSPVLVLKGRRPSVQEQDSDDYTNGYDDSGRGDINENTYAQKSARLSTVPINTVTTVAPVQSTFNPIIVPDDSFYQDYQDSSYNIPAASARKDYSESYVSSTPLVSTTERVVRIRPRVKAVTVAPTYKTVLLNEEVTPNSSIQELGDTVSVDSQTFDRYGPGGWRGRDETLQGSIDCKRAGLFRHPKQCNKFYACRWDCTKQRFTLHIFNCPVQLSFDPNLGACNWPSQGPACQGDTLLTNSL